MSELILELYSEELPFSAQNQAKKDYPDIFAKMLSEYNFVYDALEVFVGPCRITLHVSGMLKEVEHASQDIKGPRVDAGGSALLGFCSKYGITPQSDLLQVVTSGCYRYYYYMKPVEKVSSVEVLKSMLPKAIGTISWEKSMRWIDNDCIWPRPLRSILCLFDDTVVPIEYYHLQASDVTFGHKFLSKNYIQVHSWSEYLEGLQNNFVILDHKDKVASIKEQAEQYFKDKSLRNKLCGKLLDEVACSVEYPNVLCGKIDEAYASLPSELVTVVINEHQKYIPTYFDDGNLAPYFLFVTNMFTDPRGAILRDNERVAKARLEDAKFLYEKDLKVPLDVRYEQLAHVLFHRSLGSIQDKTRRLQDIVEIMALNAYDKRVLSEAAKFCKCDLVGDVVSDLSSLQGVMGYHYSLNAGLNDDVAKAILEHYKPQGLHDSLPTHNIAKQLSLIDKVDSLVGLYVVGERATGNKDPYGLRRLAIGIIRIILDVGVGDLMTIIARCLGFYSDKISNKDNIMREIVNFIKHRHKNFLLESNVGSLSYIEAVMEANDYDISKVSSKLHALEDFVKHTRYEFIVQVFKRVHNLARSNGVTAEFASKVMNDVNKESRILHVLRRGEHFSALLSEFRKKGAPELYEEYARGVLEGMSSYDSFSISWDYKSALVGLYAISLPLNTFLENVTIADSTVLKVLLGAVLERYSRVINFEYLQK
ncbi:glycine--tRNA ligase subunit beta [Candidatus Sneabacter namystus]|uniref:Glycine--tRNA ligase beta subunit n=1 Tax=Candidatus Sneabacter namystus TaxID=2601646 RepID=A0A5C0UIN8_9RICK|nr:glycine--tRNA ligase subunit beta [Candidatus Sneabacter namystus]QEK39481.1 glycine--tRNA ligase subunit beta [Candidatus Sneabacter namystus]